MCYFTPTLKFASYILARVVILMIKKCFGLPYFQEKLCKIVNYHQFATSLTTTNYLPLEILDKMKLHPWKFHKIVLQPLEFPRVNTKTYGNSTLYFFNTPGNSMSFWRIKIMIGELLI